MRTILALFGCLLFVGCELQNIQSITTVPVARFVIYQQSQANTGSQFPCGVDHTGLGLSNYYENLADDALVVGHETTGNDNRCRVDILNKMNAHVAFDLSELSSSRPSSVYRRWITSVLLSATFTPAPDFDGGEIGCRTSSSGDGIGMLDHVVGSRTNYFYPDTAPDLSNPPKSTRVGSLRRSGRDITLRGWFRGFPRVEVIASNRGAITFSLENRSLVVLQSMVNDNSDALRRFGLYFIGTNGGSIGFDQKCLDQIEDIKLTVFYKDWE